MKRTDCIIAQWLKGSQNLKSKSGFILKQLFFSNFVAHIKSMSKNWGSSIKVWILKPFWIDHGAEIEKVSQERCHTISYVSEFQLWGLKVHPNNICKSPEIGLTSTMGKKICQQNKCNRRPTFVMIQIHLSNKIHESSSLQTFSNSTVRKISLQANHLDSTSRNKRKNQVNHQRARRWRKF